MSLANILSIRDLLEKQVEIRGDKLFLEVEDVDGCVEKATYQEFYNSVLKLGNVLAEEGVKKGDKVLLHLPNSIDFMHAWFAITSLGAVMVPTNILSPKKEMDYLVQHSESKLIITEEEYVEKFEGMDVKVLLARYRGSNIELNLKERMYQAHSTPSDNDINCLDIAAILYTSGTTSKPKGVMITHANYLHAGEYMSSMLKMTSNDKGLIVLPMFHGNGQYYLTMPLITVGGSIALTEKFSATKYFEQAQRFDATIGSLFAAPMKMILKKAKSVTDHSFRDIIFAQSLTKEQLQEFEDHFNVNLLQIYGMTETVGTPLMNPLEGVRKNMSIGIAGSGYSVKLTNAYGKTVSDGEIGQITVKGKKGKTLMLGYYKDEEATKKTLKNDWLYTEDNAKILEDGYFYFVDRMKDMVKRAGENIATSEVESVLNEHPKIADSAVIGIKDEIRDVSLKALVVLKDGEKLTKEEVIDYCRSNIAKFKVPEFIEFLEEFPRTSVGKIQKAKLRDNGRIRN
ncbi:AMP-binding protein [Alkalihalophilus marmarensis]|uniref:Crotonobetaine/carnitine-CoA ligase n=1 Tax=Alkalihalophilus marmarensis DSM 21297 TaxID=1188261 RepID=U6SSJ1_9BACI|nr:AMP-binding protein [Alkalihalophilus marmarensis]ERN54603.1 hypothetical protein A33I_04470 [Alkalihalophilus marmarensis DSM 21297]MCM3488859.1 AMP-binding protein [Alkalihalophilus marmarensis]